MDQQETISAWKRMGFTLGSQVGCVELWAHTDTGYRKRTQANAECDVTMATAADYSTGGERLTKQMAAERYIALPFYLDADEAGRRLADWMGSRRARSLNVAGNGIYTLEEKGWSQETASAWILDCLSTAHAIRPIERIQSGGQTGIDWAAAVCSYKLGIPSLILFPQGFKQRGVDGIDKTQDPSQLITQIVSQAALLPSLGASEPKINKL
jgi:hypothetical protein